MRHRVAGKKLNRTSSHRKALAKNLMRSLLIEWQGKGHIVTTRSKAKFIQPRVEKLISLSRIKSVHNIRRAMSLIGDRKLVQLLFDEIGPYYKERPGGYTRLLRMVKPRLGDASVRAYLGYVREDDDYPEGDRRHGDSTGTAEQDKAAEEPQAATDTAEEEPTEESPEVDDADSGAEEPQAATDTAEEEPTEESPEVDDADSDSEEDSATEDDSEEDAAKDSK
ncbi:MAG: 50S ribosomal protein L17 [Planctomycetes bacterium]|nr:50S ribosomal protein L17 [Planctomycetota bacterium]